MFGRITRRKKTIGGRPSRPESGGAPYNHTLGSIIWMALLRLAVTLFVAWYLKDHFNVYSEWWLVTGLAIYGIAIYPAQIQYEYFKLNNRRLIEETLCSSCRYYRPENLHCTLLDEHVSEHYLPCEGEEWEPKAFDVDVEG